MKRFFLILTSIAALSLAAGCGKKKSEGEATDDPSAKPVEEGTDDMAGTEPAADEATEEAPVDEGTEEVAGEEEGEEAAAGGEGGDTGIAECDELISAYEKYFACDKLDDATKQQAQQGLDAMKQGWGNLDQMPDESKQQVADGCKQGMDALKQGAEALGCEI